MDWKNESNGNTALLIEGARKNRVCPIEIKSFGYKAHASLDAFTQKFSDRILWRYLVYTKDLSKDEDIICLPVYMVPFLSKIVK